MHKDNQTDKEPVERLERITQNKVYVVFYGDGSASQVDRIFRDEETAKTWVDLQPGIFLVEHGMVRNRPYWNVRVGENQHSWMYYDSEYEAYKAMEDLLSGSETFHPRWYVQEWDVIS